MMISKNFKCDCSTSPTTSTNSIPYTIFLYKEQLKKRNNKFLELSKVKLYLTDILITNNIYNIGKCSAKEVMNITQQIMYKERLQTKIQKIENMKKLGIENINPNDISDEI